MLKEVSLRDFTLFDKLDLDFSQGINVFIGKNSTGKTILLKLLYSIVKVLNENDPERINKQDLTTAISEKIIGVYQLEDLGIGRLVKRGRGVKNTKQKFLFTKGDKKSVVSLKFSTRSKKVELQTEYAKFRLEDAFFIPAKEILSMMNRGIEQLLEEYKFMDATYYDLAKALNFPLSRWRKGDDIKQMLKSIDLQFLDSITRDSKRDNEFFMKIIGGGNLESKLLAEGYKKFGTIIYLLKNGKLTENGYLFWDEPEANINPFYIKSLVKLLKVLSEQYNIQIFIATHNYFLIRYLDFFKKPGKVKFFSFDYLEDGQFLYCEAEDLDDLKFNSIIDEFNTILEYDLKLLNQ